MVASQRGSSTTATSTPSSAGSSTTELRATDAPTPPDKPTMTPLCDDKKKWDLQEPSADADNAKRAVESYARRVRSRLYKDDLAWRFALT
jgi:hypothetical protein